MTLRIPSALLLFTLLGCGSKPAAEPAPVSVASTPPAATPTVAPSTSSAPPVASAQPASEAERAQKGREKADSDHQAELARWTPELRAAVKHLAEASYPSADAALKAALASPHRQPGNADRDKYRHPRETLEFFGLEQSSTVLEYGPGGGWYTELLAPVLAKRGKLFVTSDDPNGPPNEHSVSGYRLKLLFETSPELYGKVEPIQVDAKSPKIPLDAKLDTVLVIREVHNLINDGSLDAWLAEFKHALKPHGVLGIEDHRAPADADVTKSAKLGYVPEAWAIQKIEAAGFKLSAKSEINANPKDTKDYPDGVWTLPPTYRLGDKDRAKYAAIGESDRFTLRFVKTEAPVPAKSK
jgi:predicted methyltransferase